MSYDKSLWIVPPGRFSATLMQVYLSSPDDLRMVFDLPKQQNLTSSRKAGKTYGFKRSYWLEKDLESWLGTNALPKLFPSGELGLDELTTLIGTKAVLVIGNQNRGQKDPLVNLLEILPHTRQNLAGTTSVVSPKFRFSFASEVKSDSAMAA